MVDPLGLCTGGDDDAANVMRKHYKDSLKKKGLWKKFFGAQDIKLVRSKETFRNYGQKIDASQMGNMSVGYTAYRHYGYLGAIAISILGEAGWPEWSNLPYGVQDSFEYNAKGIASGMMDEKQESGKMKITSFWSISVPSPAPVPSQ